MGACLALAACGPRAAARPAPGDAAPGEDAALVEVGGDWLEVRFPAVPLDATGCDATVTPPDGRRRRPYQWRVTASFRDARPPASHFTAVYVDFLLPVAVPLTEARLDSALAAERPVVEEVAGEPPTRRDSTVPTRAWARREDDRVRLRVEGAAAVRAFLRAGADSAEVGWCRRDAAASAARVPIRRR